MRPVRTKQGFVPRLLFQSQRRSTENTEADLDGGRNRTVADELAETFQPSASRACLAVQRDLSMVDFGNVYPL